MNISEIRSLKNELLKKDYNIITLLQIIYELDDTTPFEELTEQEQEKIIQGLYNYYLENDVTLGEMLQKLIEYVRTYKEEQKKGVLAKLAELKSIEFDFVMDALI